MPETYEKFREEVWQEITTMQSDVGDELDRIAKMLNDAWKWRYNIPGLGMDVKRAIENFNNYIVPSIDKAFEDLRNDMGILLSSVTGNPNCLKKLSRNYADCKRELLQHAPSIEFELQQLSKYWCGDAFAAYEVAAREQVKAMESIADAMEDASTMTSQAAEKIWKVWIDIVDAVVRAAAETIKLIGEATSVEKVASWEIPIIIKAIGNALIFAQDIAKTLEDYWTELSNGDQLGWRQMNNGVSGLPGNRWPMIHPGGVDDIVNPCDWEPV